MNRIEFENMKSAAHLCVPTLEYAATTFRCLATILRQYGANAEAAACERDAVRCMTPVYIVRRP